MVRLATSILYETLMKNCFKDWSQSNPLLRNTFTAGKNHSLNINFVVTGK